MVQHEHGFVMLKASKEDVKKLIQSNDIPNEKLIDLRIKIFTLVLMPSLKEEVRGGRISLQN